MATPAFGFSVGDFIAGIKLVKDLIDSLDEAAGAGPAYRRLAAELRSLERALTEVKNLRIHPSQAAQKVALEQAASQCQDCIETFFCENTKFSNTLGALATKSKWRTNLCKFQWAVCKPDAVSKFRAEITGHVLTVNTLMATIQL
jgi:ferredoxin-NADP reductase